MLACSFSSSRNRSLLVSSPSACNVSTSKRQASRFIEVLLFSGPDACASAYMMSEHLFSLVKDFPVSSPFINTTNTFSYYPPSEILLYDDIVLRHVRLKLHIVLKQVAFLVNEKCLISEVRSFSSHSLPQEWFPDAATRASDIKGLLSIYLGV